MASQGQYVMITSYDTLPNQRCHLKDQSETITYRNTWCINKGDCQSCHIARHYEAQLMDMTKKPTRIRRIPFRGGMPLKRIHEIMCLCGHMFNVDLGARGMEDEITCSKCSALLGKIEDVTLKRWETARLTEAA